MAKKVTTTRKRAAPKKKPAPKRSKNFEENKALIQEAYIRLLKANKRKPTQAEIAREVGITVNTVQNHFKELDVKDFISVPGKSGFRVLSDNVVLSIYKNAISGNAQSQKLWMQIIEDWSEKTENKHSGEINTAPPVILKISK